MNKSYWNILISILINFGCSQKTTAEKNDTFFAELNKPLENLTAMGYEIVHFNDANVEVRNTLKPISGNPRN